jgi:acyl-CoA thioesterase I
VLGDSLSAAYGMARSSGWVALLEERLQRERLDYAVVNASISGDTSAGGRARVPVLLERERPAVLILELGANDGLRGLPPAQMKANLAAIIEQAQKGKARVLLLGVQLPPNYGPDYTQRFEAVFRELQASYRTAWVPFLLEDFSEKAELFQADRIHPNEKAQVLILERVWKALRPLLK